MHFDEVDDDKSNESKASDKQKQKQKQRIACTMQIRRKHQRETKCVQIIETVNIVELALFSERKLLLK